MSITKQQNILVIRLSAMGDVAIMVPVLKALLTQNKNIKITVLTNPFFAPILLKNIDNVTLFAIDKKGKHKGFIGLWRLYRDLKPYNFNAIADLHNVVRSKVLKIFFFGKKCIQIDKGRKEKKDLISKKNFKQLKTSHERYADVFRKLGFKIDLQTPVFSKKENLPNKINEFLKNSGNTKMIGIAPFAAHKSKMYSLEKMKTVVEQLSKEYKILLFGGKSDVAALTNLEVDKNVISVAGKFSFSEELDIISNLDCMLSMDSGNAHLAAIYGIKVITIWGVTHPFAGFAPFYQPKDYTLIADLEKFPKIPTSIYGNKYPEEYLNAASSIPPGKIIEKIKSIL